jgi:hypothetical protein
VKADIDTATLETIALFGATGLLISVVLVLYGPDVSALECTPTRPDKWGFLVGDFS